jgi:hypothetical protein
MDHAQSSPAEELATLAHIGQQAKVIQFNAEEMSFNSEKTTEVSDSLKWAIPTAAAAVIAFLSTGYFMFNSNDEVSPEAPVVTEVETKKENFYQPENRPTPRGFVPQAQRMPASTTYAQPSREAYQPQQESRYPTHLEVHESQHFEEQVVERDPADGPVMENDQQQAPSQEHSLVGTNNRRIANQEDQSNNNNDAAVNDNQQQDQPQDQHPVDEATDF